ncbi:MAG: hypothetical protein WCC57_20680 [Paracoccaceae bacterium]
MAKAGAKNRSSEQKIGGQWVIRGKTGGPLLAREIASGHVESVGPVSKASEKVIKDFAAQQSAALVRLANR